MKLNPGFRRNHTTDGASRVLVRHRHGPDVALALSSLDDEVRRLPAAPAAAPAGPGPPPRSGWC